MHLGHLHHWITALILVVSVPSFAANRFEEDSVVQIAIQPEDTLPANDLMLEGREHPLNVLEAQQKQKWDPEKNQKLDLSTLEPSRKTEFYDGLDHSGDRVFDESIGIRESEEVAYVDTIAAATGRVRFNVRNATGKFYNILLSPTLHTILLRKEMLRKLGYLIPAMKWVPSLKIRFPSARAKDLFYASISMSTNFSGTRWQAKPPLEADPLLVEFRDVVVMDAGASNNLAFNPPLLTELDPRDPKRSRILPLRERIFRALSIPYGIVDLKKSVDLLSWSFGSVEGRFITFDLSVIGNFNTGMDDALWILRKVAKLSRSEIKTIVEGAHFPKPIENLMVEKIISRTNSLYALPRLTQVKPDTPLVPDYKISSPPCVEEGTVGTCEWPEHIINYGGVDQESPLKGIKYYILSQLQNGVVQALLNLANKEIPALTMEEAFQKHAEEMTQKAMLEWQQTGQVQAPAFKVWTAPLINGGVNLSRGPVIGNYLGTNNTVSLADSFSVSLNVGLALNTDGMPQGVQVGGLIQGSVSLNVTHVKQLFKLKQVIQEPIQNEFVPYVLLRASKWFNRVSERKDQVTVLSPEALEKELTDDFEKIRKMIGVGDSIIVSLNVSGVEQISGGVGTPKGVGPSASLGLSANQATIWRLHFQRRDENTIRVFKDRGHFNSFDVNLQASISKPAQLPVLALNFKTARGKAHGKMFTVDISKNPKENPKLFENTAALSHALKTGSLDPLEDLQKPLMIQNVFRDKSGNFRAFHHVNRKLVTRTKLDVTLPDQTSGQYLSFNFGRQRGRDFQKVATDAANFLIQLLTNQTQYNLSAFTSNAPNPGNTFYGSSVTRNANFQAELKNGLNHPFVKIMYTWQGFEKSAENTRALVKELSKKYHYPLYSEESLRDFKKIQLYQIGLSINIYEDGLKTIAALTQGQVNLILRKYREKYHCGLGLNVPCAATRRFSNAYRHYHHKKDVVKHAEALFTMAQSLEEFAEFPDLLSLVGGDKNILISPRVTGYWTESEIKPINLPPAQTFGHGTSPFRDGIIRSVEEILGLDDGEFYAQWLREVL